MALVDALAPWNPWWHEGTVPKALTGQPRHRVADLLEDLDGPRAVVLTGIRRSGKTTLMYQIAEALLAKNIEPERILYVNLEDLALEDASLSDIMSAHRQAFAPEPPRYLLLDEVQNRSDWARSVRVIVDQKKDRVAVTGSTSALLEGEAGALLTGRHRTTQVRPLDYPEYLAFHAWPLPHDVVAPHDADTYVHHLDRFLQIGGFPEPNMEDPAKARRTLQHYFTDILQRDLVARRGLDPTKVRALGGYLAKTFARPHTKSSVQKATGLSRNAIREYLEALRSAYVISPCTRFTWSTRPEIAEGYPVKYYLADPGLRNAVTSPGRDQGRLAENAVANVLERQGHGLHYWKGHGHEVDFVVVRRDARLDAIQVTYGDEVPDRETAGLEVFWSEIPKNRRGRALVLTRDSEDLDLQSMPLWRWLVAESGREAEAT